VALGACLEDAERTSGVAGGGTWRGHCEGVCKLSVFFVLHTEGVVHLWLWLLKFLLSQNISRSVQAIAAWKRV